jgi:hypothetical protein
MIQRRFFNGPVPWLTGLLWANIGVLAGLGVCLAIDRFSAIRANQTAYYSAFAVFVVAALTTGIAIANRQTAERRALRRPIANACVGLYAISLEVQRFLSTLQFISHNDVHGRSVDLAALREAVAGVERAASALAPSSLLDPADVNLMLKETHAVVADINEAFAAACQALDRTIYDRRERWAAGIRLANGALSRIGRTVEALQKGR